MHEDAGRRRLPPYVSYRTFLNFIERLQQGIPSRIDRSYWSDRLSGSTGTQLMAALRFLGLIDPYSIPTSRLRQLVSARDNQRKEALRGITSEAFYFLLGGSFDLQTATYAQLKEAFRSKFELTDGVNRKCVKFFVDLAGDSGISLSPFVTKRLRMMRHGVDNKPTSKRRNTRLYRNSKVLQNSEEVPSEMSWDKMLLTKLPAFDPAWSDDVKLGWLEVFDVLRFPTFDPTWSEEVKLKWLEAFDRMLDRDFLKGKK